MVALQLGPPAAQNPAQVDSQFPRVLPSMLSLSFSKPGVLRKGRGNRTWGETAHNNYFIIGK